MTNLFLNSLTLLAFTVFCVPELNSKTQFLLQIYHILLMR